MLFIKIVLPIMTTLRLSRSALQASDFLEDQITLVNLFSAEVNLHSLFVRQ